MIQWMDRCSYIEGSLRHFSCIHFKSKRDDAFLYVVVGQNKRDIKETM